jgi:hypothetical protein
MILRHTLAVLAFAALLYCWQSGFAKVFFISSLVFNIYLRLLSINFTFLLSEQKTNAILVLLSIFRAFLVAMAFAILIIKYHYSVLPMILAFILYKVVLLSSGGSNKP